MTTFHEIVIRHIALFDGYSPEENIEFVKLLIRNTAAAVTDNNAVAWIRERGGWDEDEDGDLLGAVIPAKLAKELIAEGRLNHPVMASATVVDWSSWREKKD